MSIIMNHILPLISILDFRLINIIWWIFLLLDGVAYTLVAYSYTLFQIIVQLNFSVISSWAQPLVNRVEALIMVLILFKLGMSFIQYMINPETFSDKNKGGTSLLINIVICAVLLVAYQFIFTLFNEFSMLIIGYSDGYEFTVLKEVADVTGEDGGDEAGLLGRLIFGDGYDSDEFAVQLSGITLFSFLMDDPSLNVSSNTQAEQMLGQIISDSKNGNYNFFSIMNLSEYIFTDIFGGDNEGVANVIYFPIISTAVGLYLAYTIIVLTIEVAVRMFKLIILEVTAPIAIITTIQDGFKSNVFKRFYSEYLSVYAGLFIRVLVVYLVTALVNMFSSNLDTLNLGNINLFTEGLVLVIIIVSLFTFAKKLPSFIDKLFGSTSGSGEGKDGFKGLMKSMGGALGLGVGAVGGAIIGGASGGAGGVLSGLVGGGFRGAVGGAKANKVSDFFKNQTSGFATTRDKQLESAENGGFLKNTAIKLGAATGVTAIKDANINKQLNQENYKWNKVEKSHDKESQAYDDLLESAAKNVYKDSSGRAYVDSYGNDIKFGKDVDEFVRKVADSDEKYLQAKDELDNYIALGATDESRLRTLRTSVSDAKNNAIVNAKKAWHENLGGGDEAAGKNIVKTHKNNDKTYNDQKKKHDRDVKKLNDGLSGKSKK